MLVFQETARTGISQVAQSQTSDKSNIVSPVLNQGYESQISEVVDFVDGIATISTNGNPFSEVAIAGVSYSSAEDPDSLLPGQYHYDPIIGRVTVRQIDSSPRGKVFLRGPSPTEASLNVLLSDPSFIELWNFSDNLKVSRKFGQHPTFSARFTIGREFIELIRTKFTNGEKITLYGIPFRIKQVSFTALSQDETSLFACDIQLVGAYAPFGNPSRHPLDQVFKLKGDDCENPLLGWQNYGTYKGLVEDLPPPYFGKPIDIFVGQKTSSEATTTLRRLLTERAIVNSQFLVWSEPQGVVAKDWGKTTLHVHNPPAKYEHQQSRAFVGAGYRDPSTKVQLTDEYRNTEIKLKNPEDIAEEEKPKVTVRWEFEGGDSLLDCQTPAQPDQVGQSILILKNPELDVFRTPTEAFDTGGFTKAAHKIFEENGVEVARYTRKYGWVHTSLDTYSVVDKKAQINGASDYGQEIQAGDFWKVIFTPYAKFSFVASAWTEVESYTSFRYYDDQGYLYKETTSGKRLTRLSQDTEDLAAIGTHFEALELKSATEEAIEKTDDPDLLIELQKSLDRAEALLALAQSYRFKGTEPIDKTITYHVGALSEYYSDIAKPSEACQWVSPKFMLRSVSREYKKDVVSNPGATDDFPLPPIVKGKWFVEIATNTVTETREPGRYVSRRYVNNQEGDGLSKKFKIISTQEHIGRPSQHQHKETIETAPPKAYNGVAGFGSGGATFKNQKITGAEEENKEYKFLLNTPNSNPVGQISEGTVSFPDVYNVDLAEKIATTKISIDNTTKAELLTFKSLYEPKYTEGDRLSFEGRIYVILSIDYSIQIDDSLKRVEDFTVQCGRLIEVPVTIEKVQNNPVDVKSVSISSGLYAIDGKAVEFKSVFSQLAPGTVANAIGLGLLGDLLDAANLRSVSEGSFEDSDLIDAFLNGGIGGASPGAGGGILIGSITQPDFEDGETVDLRIKTPLEKYAELTNYTAAISDIAKKFQDELTELLKAKFEAGQDPSEGGADLTGGSGGPEALPPASAIFNGPKPNVVFNGGDNLLSRLLSNLLGTLNALLGLLSLQDTQGSGEGSGGGSGGGGSGGDGLTGPPPPNPVLQTGTLIYNLEAPRLDELVQMILDMIAEATRLANEFDLTIEEALAELIKQKALPSGGGSGGGSGGAGGGSGSTTIVNYNFVVPEIPPNAEIIVNSPEADITNLNLEAIFLALDGLFALLETLAADLDIDFNPDEFLLGDGEAIVAPSSPETGANTVFTEDVKSDIENENIPLGLGGVNEVTLNILVGISNIGGVVNIPWSPPNFQQDPPSGGGGSGGTGGLTGGTGGFGGLTSGGTGGLPPESPASGGSSQLTDNSGGLTNGTQPIESGGAPAGTDNFAGNQGDFNYDGQQNPNNGFGDDAPFIPGTDLTITPVVPIAPDHELPLTILEPSSVEVGQVVAPNDVIHDPGFNGAIAIIRGTTASGLVIWEFADAEAPEGVVLETPYDLDLALRFLPSFSSSVVNLKVSLRGNPDIFDTLSVSTSYEAEFTGGSQSAAGIASFSADWKVDPNSLNTSPPPIGGEAGITVPTQVDFLWIEPNPGETPENYLIYQKQTSGLYVLLGETTAPSFVFDVGFTYRIDSVYREPILAVEGIPFSVETAPLVARDSAGMSVSGQTDQDSITPVSVEPPNFFIVSTLELVQEQAVNEGNQFAIASLKALEPPSVEPPNFFVVSTSESLVDQSVNEGNQFAIANEKSINPPTTEPANFYELL